MNKDIFQYFNGERSVFGDPLVILRVFTRQCEGDVEGVFKLSQSENPDQSITASEKIIRAAREAFSMLPFDTDTGAGATDEVVFSILGSFFEWWAKKKSSTESKPMSDPPTDQWEAIRNYVVSGQISPDTDISKPPSS